MLGIAGNAASAPRMTATAGGMRSCTHVGHALEVGHRILVGHGARRALQLDPADVVVDGVVEGRRAVRVDGVGQGRHIAR